MVADEAAVTSLYDHDAHATAGGQSGSLAAAAAAVGGGKDRGAAAEALAALQATLEEAKRTALASDGGCLGPGTAAAKQRPLGDAGKLSAAAAATAATAALPPLPAGGGEVRRGTGGVRPGRLQVEELDVMGDGGLCLSMHQPYASLLVRGIKQHEGRTWYSAHRGRLWIAAAAKEVAPEEISALEAFYRAHHAGGAGEGLHFPDAYPTGCLLGCVDVDDVLPQAEYRQRFPDGESESPFVFVCSRPREVVVRFPMKVRDQASSRFVSEAGPTPPTHRSRPPCRRATTRSSNWAKTCTTPPGRAWLPRTPAPCAHCNF